MTNKKKETKKEDELMKSVAAEIEVILLKNNLALKPLLSFSQEGIVPQVRLVEVNTETNVDNNPNQDEAGESKDTDGAAEPKQS